MMINYINANQGDQVAGVAGIVRSVASVVGGLLSGVIVKYLGRRPTLQLGSHLLACLSFGLLLALPDVPCYIPMAVIGFFDGCANTFTQSLLPDVCTPE